MSGGRESREIKVEKQDLMGGEGRGAEKDGLQGSGESKSRRKERSQKSKESKEVTNERTKLRYGETSVRVLVLSATLSFVGLELCYAVCKAFLLRVQLMWSA